MSEPFWNLTDGRRPVEPIPGLFADICESSGKHVYDDVYGPLVCARCGHVSIIPKLNPIQRLRVWWRKRCS